MIVIPMKFGRLFLMLGALVLASCAGPRGLQPGPHITVVPASELPPPDGVPTNGGTRPYLIGPFDTLRVSVFGVPELTQTVQVDAGGRISLPLIGGLDAARRSPETLAEEIGARLRQNYVRDPHVTVNLEETVSQVVTVDGEVREPGLYPVVGRMTLMRAIATAKGASEFARLQDVVVFRTVGEREMVALYNLQAIRRGTYPDPEIYANDVIVVGDSPARRLFRDVLQASPLFVAPIVALLQR